MNLLAHAFLSFHQPEILVGNMISDYVKGKRKLEYSTAIQKGITLHRFIDEFTDSHPATIDAKQYFRAVYRLYSGAFIDIVYDHFLANDRTQFSNQSALAIFAKETYSHLSAYENILPGSFKLMLPFMKLHNWLYNYQFAEGVRRSFGGMVRRAKYLDESDIAFNIFEKNYFELKECYGRFFPALKEFAFDQLQLFTKRITTIISYQRKIMKHCIITFLTMVIAGHATYSQSKIPALDQSSMDMSYYPPNFPILKIQDKVTEPLVARVVYSRPQKNGETVFGELVEYEKVWRIGANEATEIEFFKDVNFGGKSLPKGRYTLYTIPTLNNWVVIVNKETDTWGSFKYDSKKDILRVEVPVQKLDEPVEALAIYFDKTNTGFNLCAAWESSAITVPITLNEKTPAKAPAKTSKKNAL